MLSAVSAPATTFYLTISGLGGETDYTQRFKMWADDINGSLKRAGGDSNVVTLDAPPATRSGRASLKLRGKPSPPMPWS